MTTEKKIERLALRLQAQGPDEFPFGYYLYLARLYLARPKLEEKK